MAAESYAFIEWFDAVFVVAIDSTAIHIINFPIYTFTDSKQLFDAVTTGRQITEKRKNGKIVMYRQ